MNEREDDGRSDAGKQAEPHAAGEGRNRGGGEGADQNLALKPDVDDARAFRPKARKAGEDERNGETHAGGENDDEGVEPFHARPARQMGGCVVRRASRVATGRRNMCSSAPANSTTSPWMTTIMSRLILGMSIESAWPP